ncbi:Low molecular weight antigen MTB12 precursor [Mycobacteroides franklinii]|uniref:Low molecular weight antigen MTB12 n=2 Tax=Mycobacteroides franklinii TaxID=948102 RepID=A0A4R8R9A9_9MYCO|nr:Low molecular weight antigen MTB12 precursor [Mycobacteroides franklinii]TDZ52836.1 Low molecular weight antigen MTB12 precursor [Mycobacteroides franklinii]TDZ56243.1 Low molecular weight antigen MTB12 precursor [Mycobacteroides franklinii]TDZ63184.1 Low molecular weight antigen MTB12 precursor [Mycobacteroides franklinii]TDZ69581.1 Low molecular weight antigen MTB12 precursor [Mycobacteroides franklinii]
MSSRTGMPGVAMLGLLTAAAIGSAVPMSEPRASSPSPTATIVTASGIVPASWDAPLDVPADPADATPTSDELSGLLYSLADPGVSALAKGGLVEGGIGAGEAIYADRAFKNANRDGFLPLAFTVSDVKPTGPGLATAAVTITGPKTQAYTTKINFVNQDGWKISKASAVSLIQAASGKSGR